MVHWMRQEGSYRRVSPGPTKAEGVRHMSDFELLTVVFTVIGLLLTAFALGTKKKQ